MSNRCITTHGAAIRTRRRTGRTVAALIAVGLLAVSACAHDDRDSSGASTSTAAATATSNSSGATAFDAATVKRLDGLVGRFQDVNQSPGVLVGVWSPAGTYVSATGVADLSTQAPLEPDMQFKIASQTKTFTANLILQLVGEHKMALDDHIAKWIDGVPNGDEITIRQLLNHTSGLADGFTSPTVQGKVLSGCTVDELLTAEAKFAPVAVPGEKWSYSNYGYNLLGRVVELVTGQDLSTMVQERIAEPLGLTRTSLPMTGSGLTAPYAHGYGTGDLGPTDSATAASDATDIPGSCLWAHGGMVSTLEDMRKWSVALATGSLLTPQVWKEASTDMVQFVFSGNYNGPGQWRYGLGFVETGGFYGSEGSFAGYESATMYSPTLNTTIEVASMKMPNAITPPPMMQALAMAVAGDDVDFGLTVDQAIEPNLGAMPEAGPTTTTAGSSTGAELPEAAQLDTAIEAAMTEASIPGAIVGIWAPEDEYVKTFGVSDKASGAPMDLDSYHRIGSVTKTFTTDALLILADQGKVSLEDPISKYIDGVPSGDTITLRNLARMSSGLTTYDDSDAFVDGFLADPSQSYAPTEMLAFALDKPAKFAAGSEFAYSNTNTTLIGRVVEKVSGQSLADFVAANITGPLGMTHTSFPTTAAIPDPHAQGYTKVGDEETIATNWNPSWGWGAGNMISNLDDMRIWAKELGTGSLLKPATQQERIDSTVKMSDTAAYGLGCFDVGGWLGHSGSIFGYQTVVLYLPEQQTSLVFFTNSDVPHDASTALGKAITEVISPDHIYR
jgi:D-alanyl-D-alanine carboxypeptidase